MNHLTHNEVADYFIRFAHDHGDCLTNLKLQKLVYYAQAWYLALQGKALFDADFQAWVHGPVCPPLYSKFKHYRWNPIAADLGEIKLPDDIEQHLIEVYDVYDGYSAYQLEQMTHAESPWLEARGDLPIDESSEAVISKSSMQSFYSQLAQ